MSLVIQLLTLKSFLTAPRRNLAIGRCRCYHTPEFAVRLLHLRALEIGPYQLKIYKRTPNVLKKQKISLFIFTMPLPARFSDLKQEIAATYPDFKERATRAWIEIIEQLKEVTTDIASNGSEVGINPQAIGLVLMFFSIVYTPGQVFRPRNTQRRRNP